MPIGIALGSNLGESEKILEQSIKELKKLHEGSSAAFLVSSFYITDPVDCPSDSPLFLNAVIQLETSLPPLHLLHLLQDMEMKSGRSLPRSYHAPRTLDLDLLYYNSITMLAPPLELPHPRIRERSFVLKPLAEINPNIILPGWKQTAQYYLLNLGK